MQTFRTKYNGLPGELNSTDATAFGFVQRNGGIGHGNGDGILEYCDGSVSISAVMGCENVLFCAISDANLMDGSFTTASDASVTIAAGPAHSLYVPDAKSGIRHLLWCFPCLPSIRRNDAPDGVVCHVE